MAKYTGPTCKLARREGMDLGLKSGVKPLDSKCKIKNPPGQHGLSGMPRKVSDYGVHLREKQKLRRIYGVLERQFLGYYKRAARSKTVTGEKLLQLLESRLDNLVYRMGFASTRAEARQLVSHNHVLVDGKRVNVASYLVTPGQSVEIAEKARQHNRIKDAISLSEAQGVSYEWLDVNHTEFKGGLPRVA